MFAGMLGVVVACLDEETRVKAIANYKERRAYVNENPAPEAPVVVTGYLGLFSRLLLTV